MHRAVSKDICVASRQHTMIVFLNVETDSGEITWRDGGVMVFRNGFCLEDCLVLDLDVMPTSFGQAFLRIVSLFVKVWFRRGWREGKKMMRKKFKC